MYVASTVMMGKPISNLHFVPKACKSSQTPCLLTLNARVLTLGLQRRGPAVDHENTALYSTAILFGAVCKVMEIDPLDVVRDAGLPERIATGHGVRIPASDFFKIWDRVVAGSKRTDFEIHMGRGLANGATHPIIFALSCAPDLSTGFARFAKFKQIFGPITLMVKNEKDGLRVGIRFLGRSGDLPACLAPVILVFLHEKACSCTARRLVPKQVTFPGSDDKRHELAELFGVMPQTGDPEIIYTPQDARLPLLSENTALWSSVEQDLNLQLAQANTPISMQERVRACLIEAIGDGDPSVAYVCERLSKSRTGLLRELQEEGVTFQDILTATRKSLAMRYLRNSDMPVKRVASLLAYRDTNAFHRAFRVWTGQTPAQVRTGSD